MIKLKETNFGFASRVGEKIYINKHLKKYPKLYGAIIEHELSHTSKGYSMSDLFKDINIKELKGKKWGYWYFFFKHPLAFTQFLPFWIYEGKLVFDPVLVSAWGISVLVIFIIFKILI